MRCNAYCTASFYEMSKLVEILVSNGSEPKYFDDVVHIQKEFVKKDKRIDIFYFPFGCTVIWGAEESDELHILKELEEFEGDSIEENASDLIYYHYDEASSKTYIDEEKNEIILHNNLVFTKISISHALAQSVKLKILERSVTYLLDQTTPIQKELAQKGNVSLSKTQISKQIGVLFSEKYSINMHSDILDVPEFFWRRPSYEPLYMMTAEFQDIQIRQNIMNHRLDMINDLYSILSNELNARHSTRLEIIIIVLITMEVLIAVFDKGIVQKIISLLLGT
jgi:uncharacterized Rmd1/YagE family protein